MLAKTRHQGGAGNIAFDAGGVVQDGVLTIYTFRAGKRQQVAVVK